MHTRSSGSPPSGQRIGTKKENTMKNSNTNIETLVVVLLLVVGFIGAVSLLQTPEQDYVVPEQAAESADAEPGLSNVTPWTDKEAALDN